jgi:mono/diheme cytochrome c family protein
MTMRRTVLIAAILLPVAALAFCALRFQGCKARTPSRFESRVMTSAKRQFLFGNKAQRNPLTASLQTIADGKEAFSHYCVACHGMDGQNTGVPFADRMDPPVPSLASSDVQRYSDGQLKWVIDYGVWPSGMPGSKGILSDEEIWSIVVYLRHLPPAGSFGEPEMYSH